MPAAPITISTTPSGTPAESKRGRSSPDNGWPHHGTLDAPRSDSKTAIAVGDLSTSNNRFPRFFLMPTCSFG